MFVGKSKRGYTRDGRQFASGQFLVLFSDPLGKVLPGKEGTYRPGGLCRQFGCVRHVHLHQCGHFMMGTVRIGDQRITVSGSYGDDGLTRSLEELSPENRDRLVELPEWLVEEWNKGEGWNSAGAEAPAMEKWAVGNMKALRGGWGDGTDVR